MEKYIQLKNGTFMPRLGMGTWFLGEDLHRDSVIAIPISKKKEHVLEYAKVWDITLNKEDMEIINEEFPAPERKILLDNV